MPPPIEAIAVLDDPPAADQLRRERDDAIIGRRILVRRCEELEREIVILNLRVQVLAAAIRRYQEQGAVA